VRDLLALENVTTLASISMWADQIRLQRRETARWHFVNIPINPPADTLAAYDAERDCPLDDCVVARIDRFARALGDKASPPWQRFEALKFLVHFVADIHQPLHCANNNDAGGNGIHVKFEGMLSTLHAVWDTGIVRPAVNGDERSYALALARSITQTQAALWRGSPQDWTNESYEIAATLQSALRPLSFGRLQMCQEAILGRLLDHIVGGHLQWKRNCDAQRLSGFFSNFVGICRRRTLQIFTRRAWPAGSP